MSSPPFPVAQVALSRGRLPISFSVPIHAKESIKHDDTEQRFNDTVWSVGEVEVDFEAGEPFKDSDQRAKRPGDILLQAGTLWIKSLGLGLTFYAAEIDSIAIRESNYVPQIGYGPLDEQTLDAAGDPKTRESLLKWLSPSGLKSKQRHLIAFNFFQ